MVRVARAAAGGGGLPGRGRGAGRRVARWRAGSVVLHAFCGWLLFIAAAAAGAGDGGGGRAAAAAAVFAVAGAHLQTRGGAPVAPLTAAVAATAIVAQLELFFTALIVRGGLGMYADVWEGWAPLAGVFLGALSGGLVCARADGGGA